LACFGEGKFTMSAFSGFHLQEQSTLVDIDNRFYPLEIDDGSFAWAASDVGDSAILNALLLNGSFFRVHSMDYRGNNAIDYYALKGLYRALQYMETHCGANS
jgi:hypothetical protein